MTQQLIALAVLVEDPGSAAAPNNFFCLWTPTHVMVKTHTHTPSKTKMVVKNYNKKAHSAQCSTKHAFSTLMLGKIQNIPLKIHNVLYLITVFKSLCVKTKFH